MTRSLKNLHNLQKILACPMGLPNGSHVIAIEKGLKKIDTNLLFSDVLYVPSLACKFL